MWAGFAITVMLGGIHALLDLTRKFRTALPGPLREVFLIHMEQSIATWLTVFVTAAVGMLCISAGIKSARRGWYGVGALFLYLSMDDAVGLHERVGWVIEGRIGQDGFSFRWIQFMGPFIAVAGVAAFAFLWRRFRRCARGRVYLLMAFGMLGTALGFEVFEKFLDESPMRLRGFVLAKYSILLEECCELMAPMLLLACMVGLHEVGRGKLRPDED